MDSEPETFNKSIPEKNMSSETKTIENSIREKSSRILAMRKYFLFGVLIAVFLLATVAPAAVLLIKNDAIDKQVQYVTVSAIFYIVGYIVLLRFICFIYRDYKRERDFKYMIKIYNEIVQLQKNDDVTNIKDDQAQKYFEIRISLINKILGVYFDD